MEDNLFLNGRRPTFFQIRQPKTLYKKTDTVPQRDGAMGSTKWTLKSLWRYFEKHGNSVILG